MNCPRCKSAITQTIDTDSIITCDGCGARLMTRAAALKSQGKKKSPPAPQPAPAPPDPPPESEGEPPASSPEEPAPSEPPSSEVDGNSTPLEAPKEPASSGSSQESPSNAPAADLPPSATLPPTPAMLLATQAGGGEAGGQIAELLLRELQHLRANQEKILELLGHKPVDTPPALPSAEPPEETALRPVRSRRRKSVLLIDDDPKTREAAVAELEQADIPVRSVDDGNEALRLIAEEKPDVIALELALGGDMAAKDLINTVKATMEWVDIPIILWTREPVSTQKEARAQHGADELVQKTSGTAALANRVITVFRRS